ncbi:uncharacterized protein EAF01_001663 [Botrytis porri]|uniref:uncharacterized protein n=1 Tax=Botrytis porri TaxID=87229 RepID=UPI001901A20E|nr:uncharacterized protein EAF01_001663 [Botrytis porri]KAF7912642.1 hypothetical protein EAF01_001663 [Botrytis porri]
MRVSSANQVRTSHLNHNLTTTACADPRQSAKSHFTRSVRSDELISGDGKYIYLHHHDGHLADADWPTGQSIDLALASCTHPTSR